jgi:hypothetical protein
LDEAIREFDQAIALDGDNARAYYHRALAYTDKGELDRAIPDFNTFMALQSGYPRNISTADAGSNLAYRKPISISRSISGFYPAMAVDGRIDNWWGSGAFAPQWIRVDLEANYVIEEIWLLPSQSPAGETTHCLSVKGPATNEEFLVVHTFQGMTADSRWLMFRLPEPLRGVRYIHIETTESPSWVSWREIEVLAGEWAQDADQEIENSEPRNGA